VVTDVRHLASAKALKQLNLSEYEGDDGGYEGAGKHTYARRARPFVDTDHERAAPGIGEGVEVAPLGGHEGCGGGHDGVRTRRESGNASMRTWLNDLNLTSQLRRSTERTRSVYCSAVHTNDHPSWNLTRTYHSARCLRREEARRSAASVVAQTSSRRSIITTSSAMRMDHQRETDILQSLRHDYIVSIRSIIKDGDVVRGYLMEAMDGNLLNTTLTAEQRLVALRHCAEGLSYAHSRDITHGDVKPENCLVRVRNGVVTAKVCDFGMARVLSTMASTTIHGGTVLYTAPEGNTHPKAADVFAFGLTMWMVLSAGHDHGLGNSIADVMRGIAEGRRPPLDIPSLQALPSSDSVCELLQQCWAAAPTRRPTMAEVMLELQNHPAKRATGCEHS
jgi:serine/threonine protein kinase